MYMNMLSRKGIPIKVFALAIMVSFLCQDIAWAGGNQFLSPKSHLKEVSDTLLLFEIYKGLDKLKDGKLPAGQEARVLDEWKRIRGKYFREPNEQLRNNLPAVKSAFPKDMPEDIKDILTNEFVFIQNNIFPAMGLDDALTMAKKTHLWSRFATLLHFLPDYIFRSLIGVFFLKVVIGSTTNFGLLFVSVLTVMIITGTIVIHIAAGMYTSPHLFFIRKIIILLSKKKKYFGKYVSLFFDHELIHAYLDRNGKIRESYVLANAFTFIQGIDLNLEYYARFAFEDFIKGRRIIRNNSIHSRNLAEFKPVKLSTKLEVIAYGPAFILAGMAYEISQETGNIEYAYAYLRLLYEGCDFTEAELAVRIEAEYRKSQPIKTESGIVSIGDNEREALISA